MAEVGQLITPFAQQSVQHPSVHEDVSDGLLICRRGWFNARYTRPDCRCGQCPISDPEPCPYALPDRSSDSGYFSRASSFMSRNLSRLFSMRDVQKKT